MKTIPIAVLVIIPAGFAGFFRKRFGTVKFEEDSSFDTITDEGIAAYEDRLGFSPPTDYRNYLLRYNGPKYWKTTLMNSGTETFRELQGI